MPTKLNTARLLAPAAALCALFAAPALVRAETARPLPTSDYTSVPVCKQPTRHHETCLATRLVALTASARAHRHPIGVRRARVLSEPSALTGDFGLRPIDIHHAYLLPLDAPEGAGGERETVAVVDAYNDPAIEEDLRRYDEEFALPDCTRANRCLTVVNEHGQASPLPFPQTTTELRHAGEVEQPGPAPEEADRAERAEDWNIETSLDVETVHATCANCRILLVESSSEEDGELFEAERTADAAKPVAVTNSWGGQEEQGERKNDETAPFDDPGTVVTAAAGDEGYREWDQRSYENCRDEDEIFEATGRGGFHVCTASLEEGPLFPASSPDVVAVGGTRLTLSEADGYGGESAWNGEGAGGAGCSIFFAAPDWQAAVSDWSSVGCGEKRAVADVSADAAPETGFAVYDTDGGCAERYVGWCTIGGTSLAAPLIASAFALAGGAHGTAYPAELLYETLGDDPAALHDVTKGSDGVCTHLAECSDAESEKEESETCAGAAICTAGAGYDGPTGVGTLAGLGALRAGSTESETASERAEREANDFGIERAEEERAAKEAPKPDVKPAKAITISSLKLTPRARAAFRARTSHGRTIAFTLRASRAGRARARLYRLVRVGRRYVWRATRASRVITLRAGASSWRLTTKTELHAGRYILKVAPLPTGRGRSVEFKIA
ncbi:MAG TPA: S8 family serine peptidase [Solirubrobacteraceae bacterium]|nr:S8 family serine peptidase [Solirubrobacteraceae bacterium]